MMTNNTNTNIISTSTSISTGSNANKATTNANVNINTSNLRMSSTISSSSNFPTNNTGISSTVHSTAVSTSTGGTTSTGRTTAINNFVTSLNIMDKSNNSSTAGSPRRSIATNINNMGNHQHNNGAYHNIHHNSGGSSASINSRDDSNNNNNNNKQYPTQNRNYKKKKSTSTSSSKNKKNSLRVLGIAIIVDQKGSGARMLARYPTTSQSLLMGSIDYNRNYDDDDNNHDNNNEEYYDHHQHRYNDGVVEGTKAPTSSSKSSDGDDDLFFTLTARQMAKLFRTKKALCNQPMTLRVNKTIFCCHAVLLENNKNNNNSNNNKPVGSGYGNGNGNGSRDNDKQHPPSLSSSPPPPRDALSISSSVIASEGDNDDNDNDDDDQLRLFSVVVALSGSTQQSALPFSSFWDTGSGSGCVSGEDRLDLERYMRQLGNNTDNKGNSGDDKNTTQRREKDSHHHNRSSTGCKKKKELTSARVSSVFLAIRRVHISLIRFCRALHREENRCGYVTYQSRVLFRIRNERQKQWEAMYNNRPGSSSASTLATNVVVVGGGGCDRNVGVGGHQHHTPRHSRQNSFMTIPGSGDNILDDTALKNAFDNNNVSGETLGSIEQEQEKEQEIFELMLACNPQDHHQHQYHSHNHNRNQQPNQSEQQDVPPLQQRQGGNIIRDLVAVFNSLSRNDHEYPPTPNSLLCERDAVVYVNQHLAIPIEAAGLNGHSYSSSFAPNNMSTSSSSSRQHLRNNIMQTPADGGGSSAVVRTYYTLLFPHASPSELLQTFHSSGSVPPQQMEHLLLTVNPQKSLTQIAIDANLPLHTTMHIASFLVAHGACITSPIVTSRSRLTCHGNDCMQRIPELALDFSQDFPGINLFGVVSFLTTSSRHLGDSMSVLVDTEIEDGAWLRESLLASPKYRYYHNNRAHGGDGSGNGTGGAGVSGGGNGSGADGTAGADPIKGNIINGAHTLIIDEESYSPIHASYASSRGGEELEELLYAIAIWLLSHRILTQLQEFMVMVAIIDPPQSPSLRAETSSSLTGPPSSLPATISSTPTTTNRNNNNNNNNNNNSINDPDENLFKELIEMDYLNGDITIMAMSWRMAIDPIKLRRWGLRHKRVRIISRVQTSTDDWEQPIPVASPSLPVES